MLKSQRIRTLLNKSGIFPSDEVISKLADGWDDWAIESILSIMSHMERSALVVNPWYVPQAKSAEQLRIRKERHAASLMKTTLALPTNGHTYYEVPGHLSDAIASGELVVVPANIASMEGIVVPAWLGKVIAGMFAELPRKTWMVTSGARSLAEQALLQNLGYPAVTHGANNLREPGLGGFNLAVANPFYKDTFLAEVDSRLLQNQFADGVLPVTLASLRKKQVIANGSKSAEMVDHLFEVAEEYGLEVVELTDLYTRDENGAIGRLNPVIQIRRTRA